MKQYNITNQYDEIDRDKYNWLKNNVPNESYCIRNNGFLIDNYILQFSDQRAEVLYLLKFGENV